MMVWLHPTVWTSRRWAAVVAVLLAVIVLLLLAWPRPAANSDGFVIRIVNHATPISTVVVPVH